MGYDGMVSVPFLIEVEALEELGFLSQPEASALAAFDAARSSIFEIARRIYSASRQTSYRIAAEDCR
ncbi:hypothetical protein ABID37_004718 [Aquamicrobium terrae]|uniref:DUF1488 domain-containing protein n=2 Tax=Aquamicrobium terrae TaxID=1324945 RepID=A0ABV2N6N7_9HYPH